MRATLSVTDDGEGTACRLMKTHDEQTWLQILDTLDYALRWGNYSANYAVEAQQSGTATLMFDKLKGK